MKPIDTTVDRSQPSTPETQPPLPEPKGKIIQIGLMLFALGYLLVYGVAGYQLVAQDSVTDSSNVTDLESTPVRYR